MTYGVNEPRTGKPANGYPSFCWHCGRQLNWLRDETVDYETVRDWGGAEHRVHVTCVDAAIGDGVQHVPRDLADAA